MASLVSVSGLHKSYGDLEVLKGVDFEVTIAGGVVVASRGVDTDLIIKPFHQAGVVLSLREFTDNAMNHHHGIRAEERFDIPTGEDDFYFVHGYRPEGVPAEAVIGTTDYGEPFPSAVATESAVAVQFHPEKSQRAGLAMLERYCAWRP